MNAEAQERKDIWKQGEDELLIDTVLEYIRSGRTQLEAFETVSAEVGRTPAACGFRWNSELRKRCEDQIKAAKQERAAAKKMKPSAPDAAAHLDIPSVDPLEAIARNIQNYRMTVDNMKRQIRSLSTELAGAQRELAARQERIAELEQANEQLRQANPQAVLSEDAQTLIKILQRARDIGAIQEQIS